MPDDIDLQTEPIEGLDPNWQHFIEERLGHSLETPPPDEPAPDDGEEVEEVPEPEGDEGEDDGAEDDGEGEAEEVEPPAPVGYELAPGVTLDHDTALTLYQFDQLLRERPDVQTRIQEALGAPQPAPAAPGPAASLQASPVPELPPLTDDDLVDPAVKALYDYTRAQSATIADLQTQLGQVSQITQVRDTRDLMDQVVKVKAEFATKHELTPEQVDAVGKHAEDLGVTRNIYTAPDRPKAITDALELAYWSMPEHRTEALEKQVQTRAVRAKKRQRLAGVGGGGGGETRRDTAKDPRTMNENERRRAMAMDVAEQTGYTYDSEYE